MTPFHCVALTSMSKKSMQSSKSAKNQIYIVGFDKITIQTTTMDCEWALQIHKMQRAQLSGRNARIYVEFAFSRKFSNSHGERIALRRSAANALLRHFANPARRRAILRAFHPNVRRWKIRLREVSAIEFYLRCAPVLIN